MDIDINEEQEMLRKTAKSFFENEYPKTLVREMNSDEKGYDPAMWKKMADLGWMGLIIPEEYGGIGGDFIDLSVLLEEVGSACMAGPFFSTVVLGSLSILAAGSEEQKKELLPKIVSGESIYSLALMEPGAWYDASGVSISAKAEGDEFVINGTKLFVENAHIADYILCVARTKKSSNPQEGLTLFLIDAKDQGIKCTALDTITCDKQFEVAFNNVKVSKDTILGKPGEAWDTIDNLLEQATVAKCAEIVGIIQTTLDMTVKYTGERKQFDRHIGSFQALQHYCADMLAYVDGSRYSTYYAAWRITEGLPITMDTAIAKAWASKAARFVTLKAHQIHGAIAYCDEYDLHLFYRRAKAGEIAFGDCDYNLEKVAQQMGL